jgi:hypothetical protein
MATRRTIGRRSRRHARLALPPVLLVAAVALAGCSSDDGKQAAATTTKPTTTVVTVQETTTTRPPIDPDTITGGKQAYVDAMLASLDTLGGGLATKAQAECIAPKWVDIIGVEGFAAAGVAPEDFQKTGSGLELLHLDATKAGKMADAFGACGMDLEDVAIAAQDQNGDLPDDVVACLHDALTPEAARNGFIAGLTGKAPTDPALQKAAACAQSMAPEESIPPMPSTTLPGG